jgi:hypothetical protein
MEALLGFTLTIAAIGWLALTIWFVVISVRFLRAGRKAFDRYVELTAVQARRLTRPGPGPRSDPFVETPAPPAPKW